MEIWKDIKGFEGVYWISNKSRVFNIIKKRFLKLNLKSTGYLAVTLCANGKKKDAWPHRLVAEAFIPNPENKPQVNHINGNKADCRIENLEWVTASENRKHAYRIGLQSGRDTTKHLRKPIRCIETGKEYESVRFAARQLGVAHQNLNFAVNHGIRCGGLHFQFIGV